MKAKEVVAKARTAELARRNEDKWGKTLWQAGWTALPSTILTHQARLGIDPLDLNILLQIAKHWWENRNLPHPSKRRIAESIGVDPRTVQRRVTAMEKAGLIERIKRSNRAGGQGANSYSFEGLKRKASAFAKQELEARERSRSEERTRRTPRRMQRAPGLQVVRLSTAAASPRKGGRHAGA